MRWTLVCATVAIAMAGSLCLQAKAELLPVMAFIGSHAQSRGVMSSRYIHVGRDDALDVSFDDALEALTHESLLDEVQAEYARQLPEGEAPEFVIQQVATNRYRYANRKGHGSDITEICRRQVDADSIVAVYYVSGERFFGRFESLVFIDVKRAAAANVRYRLDVYAYPEVAVARFLARHLGLLERYFNRKTDALADISREICRTLCAPADRFSAAR